MILGLILGFALGVWVSPWVRAPLVTICHQLVGAVAGRQAQPVSNRNGLARANGAPARAIASNWLKAAGNVAGFLLRYWKPIALICLALAIMGVLRGCHLPFVGDIGKSRGEIILERDLAIRGAEIAAKTGQAALEIHAEFNRAANRINQDLATGREEIHAASSHETRDLFLAFARSDQRLCASAGGCGADGA